MRRAERERRREIKLGLEPGHAECESATADQELRDLFLDYEMKSNRAILLITLVRWQWLKSWLIDVVSARLVRKTARKLVYYFAAIAAERQVVRIVRKAIK